MALGIIFMIAGVIALGSVVMATVSAIFVIGVMMIMAGVTEIITAFNVKDWGKFALWLLLGVLYVAAGVICFFRPLRGRRHRHPDAGHRADDRRRGARLPRLERAGGRQAGGAGSPSRP